MAEIACIACIQLREAVTLEVHKADMLLETPCTSSLETPALPYFPPPPPPTTPSPSPAPGLMRRQVAAR